jgi:hypothetical protein
MFLLRRTQSCRLHTSRSIPRTSFRGERKYAKRHSEVVRSDQGLRFHPARRRWRPRMSSSVSQRSRRPVYVACRRSQGDVRHRAEPRQGEPRRSADRVRPITRMFLTVMAVALCAPNSVIANGSKSIGPVATKPTAEKNRHPADIALNRKSRYLPGVLRARERGRNGTAKRPWPRNAN